MKTIKVTLPLHTHHQNTEVKSETPQPPKFEIPGVAEEILRLVRNHVKTDEDARNRHATLVQLNRAHNRTLKRLRIKSKDFSDLLKLTENLADQIGLDNFKLDSGLEIVKTEHGWRKRKPTPPK